MPPSIFIHAKNVFLHQLPDATPGITLESAIAGTAEGFTAGDMATTQADGFRRGQHAQPVFAETRELGDGEEIPKKQALKELEALGPGWRFETPQEQYATVTYDYKNQYGAYTRDESRKAGYYWSNQETPWCPGGRVVVGFYLGNVDYGYDDGNFRAFARAVRVAGQ